MRGFLFAPTWSRTLPANLAGVRSAVAALGLVVALTFPSHAQAPNLGTDLPSFAVLGASTVTNTNPSVLTGNLGVSPGTAITGFPPGIYSGARYTGTDALAAQAHTELNAAILQLAGRTITQDLTGLDLGGRTLTTGVYGFNTSAGLTGTLTLNGSANDVFIFKIGSTLTTAAASSVVLTGGAQAGNVFWDVGSSATLGTTTSFLGDILATASITLTTGAKITCGSAWASTAAVTLDTNTISTAASCTAAAAAATTAAEAAASAALAATSAFTISTPTAFAAAVTIATKAHIRISSASPSGLAPSGLSSRRALLDETSNWSTLTVM